MFSKKISTTYSLNGPREVTPKEYLELREANTRFKEVRISPPKIGKPGWGKLVIVTE